MVALEAIPAFETSLHWPPDPPMEPLPPASEYNVTRLSLPPDASIVLSFVTESAEASMTIPREPPPAPSDIL